jgi:hypothetical protein
VASRESVVLFVQAAQDARDASVLRFMSLPVSSGGTDARREVLLGGAAAAAAAPAGGQQQQQGLPKLRSVPLILDRTPHVPDSVMEVCVNTALGDNMVRGDDACSAVPIWHGRWFRPSAPLADSLPYFSRQGLARPCSHPDLQGRRGISRVPIALPLRNA